MAAAVEQMPIPASATIIGSLSLRERLSVHSLYVIVCTPHAGKASAGDSWTVSHRYSDFQSLHVCAKKCGLGNSVAFPPKTWGLSPDATASAKRLTGLQAWLTSLLFEVHADVAHSPSGTTAAVQGCLAKVQSFLTADHDIVPRGVDATHYAALLQNYGFRADKLMAAPLAASSSGGGWSLSRPQSATNLAALAATGGSGSSGSNTPTPLQTAPATPLGGPMLPPHARGIQHSRSSPALAAEAAAASAAAAVKPPLVPLSGAQHVQKMLLELDAMRHSHSGPQMGKPLPAMHSPGAATTLSTASAASSSGANSGASTPRSPDASQSPAAIAAPLSPSSAAAASVASPKASVRVGVDSFELLKVLGKGSFGKVLLVRRKPVMPLNGPQPADVNHLYALKILRKEHVVKQRQVEHTLTERRVLEHARHPFIVQLHYAFQSADKLFFVLTYAAGGELFFHLSQRGTFPEHMARFYVAELVLALGHLHAQGVVYRDLKPENILIDAAGHLKLADFGLSKENVRDATSGSKSFCGTPEYLAPEIITRGGHGFAVDWWSLGMLLYEMLTGLPPWFSKDRNKLYERLQSAPLEFPDTVSPAAQSLLRGLLTRDPSHRLGAHADARQVMADPFFASVDWKALYSRTVTPPFVPRKYMRSEEDVRFFDAAFTKLPADILMDGELPPVLANAIAASAAAAAAASAAATSAASPVAIAPAPRAAPVPVAAAAVADATLSAAHTGAPSGGAGGGGAASLFSDFTYASPSTLLTHFAGLSDVAEEEEGGPSSPVPSAPRVGGGRGLHPIAANC